MIKRIVLCDICGEPIPVIEKNIDDINFKIKILDVGNTKEFDTKFIFDHLCKKCALMVDNEFLKFKLSLIENIKEK